MRYERALTAIYERWLAAPGNSGLPGGSADEVHHHVMVEQFNTPEEEFFRNQTSRRRYTRLMQQNHWLSRFIEAWTHFQGESDAKPEG